MVVMVIVIVAGIAVSIFASYRINNKLAVNYNREQRDIATQTANNLKIEVTAVQTKLLYLAQVEAVQSLDSKTCNAKIDEIIKTLGADLGNIGRIGPDGVFYCSGNKELIGIKGETFGTYVSDIFKDPEHKPVMSHMVYPKGATSYLLAVHVPVYNSKGLFVGTLGGAISTDNLAKNLLNNVKIGKTGFVSVIDDNGDIIYSRDKNFVGKNRYGNEIQKATGNDETLNKAFEDAKKGTDQSVRYTANGEARMAVMTSAEVIPGRRWVVYGVIPMTEVSHSADEFGLSVIYRRLIIGYSLALLTSAFFVLRFMRRRIFKPLRALNDVAQKVERGGLDSRVPVNTEDELGQLSASFNKMLDQLHEYNRDLEERVDQQTNQLKKTLQETEKKNSSLENTKKAMLNVFSDLATEKTKLATETTRSKAMFDSMGDALIVTDQYSKIVQINPVAEKLLGVSAKKLIGKWYPGEISIFDKDGVELPPDQRPISRAIATGKAIQSREYSLAVKGSKNILPVALTVSPLIQDDHPLGVVEVFRDVTLERELDQAKDDFVSLVSHQLRTPATAVKQFLGMIREGYAGKVTKEQEDFVETAYESNERQIGIIDDLLNVSRLDLGKLKPSLQSIDITALMKDIYQIMLPKAAERNQTLELDAPTSYTLMADPNIIRMAIENFVDNASKYTPDGGTIKLSVKKVGKHVNIAIADNGVGIAAKDLKKLYKKFSRIDNKLSVLRGGSGLGLYIARQIIELHHGKLLVESKVGKGTTFTIQLSQE